MQFEQGLLGLSLGETMSAHDWRDGIGHFCIADYLAELDEVHLVRYYTPNPGRSVVICLEHCDRAEMRAFTGKPKRQRLGFLLPGKVFIVTDGCTFSAALVTVAFLKDFAHGQAQIVGQHVGDKEQFWAEGNSVIILPNSKLHVWVATAYHDWEYRCSDWSKCYWINILFGAAAGKLDVDLPAPSTFAAYRSGRDESLDTIRLFLRAQH